MVFKTCAILMLLAAGASAQGILNNLPDIVTQQIANKDTSHASEIDCLLGKASCVSPPPPPTTTSSPPPTGSSPSPPPTSSSPSPPPVAPAPTVPAPSPSPQGDLVIIVTLTTPAGVTLTQAQLDLLAQLVANTLGGGVVGISTGPPGAVGRRLLDTTIQTFQLRPIASCATAVPEAVQYANSPTFVSQAQADNIPLTGAVVDSAACTGTGPLVQYMMPPGPNVAPSVAPAISPAQAGRKLAM